jgi:hypothetical protein
MAIEISDYVKVEDRAAALGFSAPQRISILPENFDVAQSATEFHQRSEAATVRTLLRQAGVPTDHVSGVRGPYVQNNGFEWVSPVLFIASGILSESPSWASVSLGVLTNYLTRILRQTLRSGFLLNATVPISTIAGESLVPW